MKNSNNRIQRTAAKSGTPRRSTFCSRRCEMLAAEIPDKSHAIPARAVFRLVYNQEIILKSSPYGIANIAWALLFGTGALEWERYKINR
jgi:hypothetical protein